MKLKYLIGFVFTTMQTLICLSQTVISTPLNLSAPTNIRNATKINLTYNSSNSTGFQYGVLDSNSSLLNLNISSYPSYINNNYTKPSDDQTFYSFNPALDALVTSGSYNVDNTGSFNYNIPILCSPGTADMQPNLTINYNNRSGNGWLGLGFELGGVSKISRGGRSLFHDGVKGAIRFNSSDIFELDGIRLKTINGTTFKTEIENYSDISFGSNSFLVKTSSGQIMEYGNTGDSRLLDVGGTQTMAWYLNKVYDEFGNYMTFSYTNSNGEILIDHIDYTGNSINSKTTYNRIEFIYSDRSDANSFYFEGKEFRRTKILAEIKCLGLGGALVRKYKFDYEYDFTSMLSKITESDGQGNTLNPTFFKWTNFGKSGPYETNNSMPYATTNPLSIEYSMGIPAELNGDGRKDLLLIKNTNSFQANIRINSKTSPQNQLPGQTFNPEASFSFEADDLNKIITMESVTVAIAASFVCDEDHDNKEEVYIIYQVPSQAWYKILQIKYDNNGNLATSEYASNVTMSSIIRTWAVDHQVNKTIPFNSSGYFFSREDVTGDNLTDMVIVDENGLNLVIGSQTLSVSGNDFVKTGLGDFDGDGVLDIFTVRGTFNPFEVKVYRYDATNNSLANVSSLSFNVGLNPNIANWIGMGTNTILSTTFKDMANIAKSADFGDFNGDGKTDFMYINYLSDPDGKAYVMKSDGLTFLSDNNPLDLKVKVWGVEANFSALDVNNDGYCDLVLSAFDGVNMKSYFDYCPSNGNFLTSRMAEQEYADAKFGAMADFDGDGSLDYLYQDQSFTKSKVTYNLFNQNSWKTVKKIFNLKDNIEVRLNFLPQQHYPDGSYRDFYSATAAHSNTALTLYKPKIHLVTQITANRRNFYYAYRNVVYHYLGKGFLGFSRMACGDDDKGTYNDRPIWDKTFTFSSTYDLITSTTEKGRNNMGTNLWQPPLGSNLNEFYYNETNYTFSNGTNNRFLSQKEEKYKDYLNGTYNVLTTIFGNNVGGNILLQTSENLTWNGQSINSTNLGCSYHALSYPGGGTFYRPDDISVTKNAPGFTSKTNVTSYNYDSNNHLKTLVKNSTSSFPLTCDFGTTFDSFGQPLDISYSGALGNIPRYIIQYDATGRFMSQITNTLNQTQYFSYEPLYGNLLQSTDAGGLVSKFEYDSWGRLIRTISPTGALNSAKYEWHLYTDPTNSLQDYGVKITTNVESQGEQVDYFNFKGNPIKTEGTGFGGTAISSENTYELFGERLISSTEPHFNNQTKFLRLNYQWDVHGRPITISELDNNNNNIRDINYSYNTFNAQTGAYSKGSCTVQVPAANGSGSFYRVQKNNEAGQIDVIYNYSGSNSTALHSAVYTYNQFGMPDQVVSSFPGNQGGATTTFAYDDIGRRTSINDPSSGITLFAYNSMGELTSMTKPGNNVYTYAYDELRRLATINGPMGIYTYEYVTSGNGMQQLKKITGPDVTTEYAYDSYSRPTQKKESLTIGFKQFISKYSFDKYNRLVDYTYPGNFKTTNSYDSYGNLTEIKNGNTSIWQLTAMQSPGLFKTFTNSSGLNTQISYDNSLNLQQVDLGTLNSQGYSFNNKTGNLLTRTYQNTSASGNEGFSFDDFDRLVQNTETLGQSTNIKSNYTYHHNGNLTHKDDCGDYNYTNTSHPYWLTQITNPTNNTSFNTLNVSYNSLDKVSQITEASTPAKQFDFLYGNDAQRIKMEYRSGGTLQYTRYYQDSYDREETSNTYRDWSYVYSPAGLAAVYFDNNSTKELLFVNTDHLGSPIILTNLSGQKVEEYSFDAWGRRRDPNNWNTYTNLTPPTKMIRGYTGHEHLDEVGIINMNGRVYDPVLGRFIQPDPLLQDPGNLQNCNRYSYVLNNPLKYIDPSGYAGGTPSWERPKRQGTALINDDGTYYHTHAADGGGGYGGGTPPATWSAPDSFYAPTSDGSGGSGGGGIGEGGGGGSSGGGGGGSAPSRPGNNAGGNSVKVSVWRNPVNQKYLDARMVMMNAAVENIQGSGGTGEFAPNSVFTMRKNDVGYEMLLLEFMTGIGPEYSGFGQDHPLTKDMKESLIVKLAMVKFSAGGGKPLINYDVPFGLLSIPLANGSMIEQFVGGARVSIIPTSGGTAFIINNSTGWYSASYHRGKDIDRVPGKRTPYGTIYQRFMWIEK